MKASILIVEDEAITALNLRNQMIAFGYDVGPPVGTGEEAVERALREKPSCILMDINLIGAMSGIEAAEMIIKASDIPIIYMTGYSDSAMKSRAMRTRPVAYLEKPVDTMEVNRLLKQIDARKS